MVPSWINIAASNIKSDIDFGFVDCGAQSYAISHFGYFPMPIVEVVHIAYPRKHRGTKDTPDRYAKFCL